MYNHPMRRRRSPALLLFLALTLLPGCDSREVENVPGLDVIPVATVAEAFQALWPERRWVENGNGKRKK